MRRISSLPTLQYCGKSDQLGVGIETTNAFRSTIFHKYCETGEWDKALVDRLPTEDFEEIQRWKKPKPFAWNDEILTYRNSIKELTVALGPEFRALVFGPETTQEDLENDPEVFLAGHLDFCWVLGDLIIIVDIKSSIFAVKDRCESLQLHGYGIAACKLYGKSSYVTAIWDASEGKYYVNNRIIDLDSFDALEIQERITNAVNNKSGYVKGTHCSGCWKRDSCPAHLVDVSTGNPVFDRVLSGNCSESDIRAAIVDCKSLGDLANKISDACKSWVKRHGPLRSEDGTKQWTCALRDGKKSLDTEAVKSALGVDSLDKFMKEGKPYEAFDWRNVK